MAKHHHHLGWKLELLLAAAIFILMTLWVNRAEADGYENEFHLAPHAEEIVKEDGIVLWRVIDGPVRCYIVITKIGIAKGVETELSCVIPDTEKETE